MPSSNSRPLLIINDATEQLGWMKELLSGADYAVQTAESVEGTFQLAKRVRPTLIISDASPPDENGIELCRIIRSDTELRSIPILLFSASSKESELAVKGLQAGANDYIEAPCPPALLLMKVSQLITARLAEEALIKSEDRYRDLVDHGNELICTHDMEGQILSVNPWAAEALGIDQEVLVKSNIRDILAPTVREGFDDYLDAIRKEGSAKGLMLVQTSMGEKRIWEYHNTLRTEGVEEPVVRGMAHDVTEQILVEESLRQSEKDYRGLFEQAHDAVIVFDPEGEVVLEVNQRACEIYGYSRAEFIGMSLERISKDVSRGKSLVEETLKKGGYLNFQTTQYRKEGTEVLFEINAAALEYKGRRAILSINRDITERKRAEKALRDSEQKYRMLIEQASDGIMVADRDGKIEVVNSTACRELGYTREELIGMKFTDLMPEGDLVSEPIRWAELQTGNIIRGERRVRRKDGIIIPVEVSAKLLDDGRLQAFVRDIVDRKLAEEELKKREAQLMEAQRLAHVGSWEWDISIDKVTWSEELYRMWGVSPQEFDATYDSVRRLVHPDDRHVLDSMVERAYREHKPYIIEHRIIRPDGEIRMMYSRGEVVLDEAGRAVRMVGMAQDITERKRVEEALRCADQRALQDYERLLDRIATLGQVLGTARDLLTVYRALQEFAVASTPCSGIFISLYDAKRHQREAAYAWSEGEEEDVSKLPPMPMNESPNSRAVLTGEVIITDDFQATTAGLPTIYVGLERDPRLPQSSLVSPMAVMGRVIGAVEVQSSNLSAFNQSHATAMRMAANLAAVAIENVRFLEREREQEEQFLQAQKMEAVGHLAGGVAHDFNNLVAVILLHSELMMRHLAPGHDLRRRVEEIQKAGNRAASLTRQLLAFSRKQVLQPKVIDLNMVVADMNKMLQRLIGEHIELLTSSEAALGQVKVDPGQIEQVIMNLAVNARDAMPEGGRIVIKTANVELGGRAHADQPVDIPPGRYVMLSVSDTGCGMDAQTQAHIFEPFFTTKEQGKGTGLGLSTVYGIIKQSGGDIRVYSQVRTGTTFKIYLPRVDQPVEEGESDNTLTALPPGTETVLLVEDEEMVRKAAREILELSGYHVLEAAGGSDALMICQNFRHRIHLTLTDVVMPQMSARELTRHLTSLRPDMKVLYMSGYTDDAIARHGVLEPGIAFIEKPFTAKSLTCKVRELLDAP